MTSTTLISRENSTSPAMTPLLVSTASLRQNLRLLFRCPSISCSSFPRVFLLASCTFLLRKISSVRVIYFSPFGYWENGRETWSCLIFLLNFRNRRLQRRRRVGQRRWRWMRRFEERRLDFLKNSPNYRGLFSKRCLFFQSILTFFFQLNFKFIKSWAVFMHFKLWRPEQSVSNFINP